MKTIYIAGKVTGEPIAECTLKFGTAQKQIEAHGYAAVNPLSVVNDWHTTWEQAMRKCIKALADCDAILLLPDYHLSKGAMMEQVIASDFKMPIFYSLQEFKKQAPKIEAEPVETCCKRKCNNPVYQMKYCFDHFVQSDYP